MDVFKGDERKNEESRDYQRHNIPAAVNCTFFEGVFRGKGNFQGFIQDISCGGVSLEIRDDFLNIQESLLLYTNIAMTVEFNLPDGNHRMDFSGIIRWYKRIKKRDRSCLYLGIRFDSLDEQNKKILKDYLSLGTGDKNLIWNLWDNRLAQR